MEDIDSFGLCLGCCERDCEYKCSSSSSISDSCGMGDMDIRVSCWVGCVWSRPDNDPIGKTDRLSFGLDACGLERVGECIGGSGEVATAGLGLPLEEDVLPWLDTLMTDSRWLLEVTEYLLDRCERLAVRRRSCSCSDIRDGPGTGGSGRVGGPVGGGLAAELGVVGVGGIWDGGAGKDSSSRGTGARCFGGRMVVEEDERASIGDSMASLGARENPAQTQVQNGKMAKNKQRLRKKLSISDLSFFGNLRSGVPNASVNPGNHHRKSRINLLATLLSYSPFRPSNFWHPERIPPTHIISTCCRCPFAITDTPSHLLRIIYHLRIHSTSSYHFYRPFFLSSLHLTDQTHTHTHAWSDPSVQLLTFRLRGPFFTSSGSYSMAYIARLLLGRGR